MAYLAGVPFTSGQEGTGEMQPSTLMFTVTSYDLDRFYAFLEENPDQVGIKEEYAAGYDLNFLRTTPGHCFIGLDRKSTRLNSSHVAISYAVFCLKKKK